MDGTCGINQCCLSLTWRTPVFGERCPAQWWLVAKTGSRSSNSDEFDGTRREAIEKAVFPVSAFLVTRSLVRDLSRRGGSIADASLNLKTRSPRRRYTRTRTDDHTTLPAYRATYTRRLSHPPAISRRPLPHPLATFLLFPVHFDSTPRSRAPRSRQQLVVDYVTS